jgi:hypothetical protein
MIVRDSHAWNDDQVMCLVFFFFCLQQRYPRPPFHIYGKSRFHFLIQYVKVMHGVGTIFFFFLMGPSNISSHF